MLDPQIYSFESQDKYDDRDNNSRHQEAI
jgi:hypothetical protein